MGPDITVIVLVMLCYIDIWPDCPDIVLPRHWWAHSAVGRERSTYGAQMDAYGERGNKRTNDSFSVPLAVEVSSDGSGGYHQIEGHAVLLCIVLCLSCIAAQRIR